MLNRRLFYALLLVVFITLISVVQLHRGGGSSHEEQVDSSFANVPVTKTRRRGWFSDDSSSSPTSVVVVVPSRRHAADNNDNDHASDLGHHSHNSAADDQDSHLHSKTASRRGTCVSLALHANASQVAVTRVQLCGWSPKSCGGDGAFISVQLDSSECSKPPPSSLSGNAELKQSMLRRGPHMFRLRFDGPTVFVVPQNEVVDRERCEYRFELGGGSSSSPYFLRAGNYRIGLEVLYRNYAYLDEGRDVWPELLKTPLLNVQPSFVTKYHLQQCTLPSREVLACFSNHPDLPPPPPSSGNLPKCDGTQVDTSGLWHRTNSGRSVSTRVRVRKIRKEPILFEWALQSEPEARWVPTSCSIVDAAREDIFSRFDGKRIVISGDSQLRALYYAVVNTLLGNGDKCVRNITTQLSEPAGCVPNVKGSQRKSLAYGKKKKIQVDYIDDLFLNRIKHKLRGYDVVVAGFGQHPASKEHWRFDKYRRAVAQKMSDLESLGGGGGGGGSSNVIWYSAPHYPHTRQGYPVFVRDWRTDARLELFNNCSVAAARAKGFKTLDSFSISDAFIHTSPDQAHFSNFVAAEFVRMFVSIVMSL